MDLTLADAEAPVFNEVLLIKGSLLPFQSTFIPTLSSVACLEAYCTSSTLKPTDMSDLEELTGSDPLASIAVDDTRLDCCLVGNDEQTFTWTLNKFACDSLTLIVHEPFSRGVRSSAIEYAIPGGSDGGRPSGSVSSTKVKFMGPDVT
jgi:hypothetical protein